MRCPECQATMSAKQVAEAVVYECSRCRGMWFPRGELDAVKDEVLPEMEWMDLDRWKREAEFSARATPNFCPACGGVALTRIHDRHSATEIDICPRCKGTWLPTGQFLNLVNALIDEANRTSAPEYVHISLQKAKDMLTHPSGLSSDWKDLKTVLRMLKHRFFVENPTLESILVGLQKSLPL